MSLLSYLCRRNFSKPPANKRILHDKLSHVSQFMHPLQSNKFQSQDSALQSGPIKGQKYEGTLARNFSQSWQEHTRTKQVHENYLSMFQTQDLNEQDRELYEMIRQMPKIELHTHIGGCMRQGTFLELAKERDIDVSHISFQKIEIPKTAWEIFAVLNQIVTDCQVLARSTKEVIEDYHTQGCVYLELRSTPKVIGQITSYELYIRTVLEAILEAEEQFPGIKCAFLFSFKREWSIEEFSGAVDLYLELIEKWNSESATPREREMVKRLVGIDLSGNPSIGHFTEEYQQELRRAQKKGVKIALHCAEVVEQLDTQEMIDFAPDRLGHCTYLTPKEVRQVVEMGITAEICPASNMAAKQLNSAEQLPHLQEFNKYDESKIAIGCDDTLLFQTDLTKELFRFAKATDRRNKEEIESLIKKGASSAFLDDLEFKI